MRKTAEVKLVCEEKIAPTQADPKCVMALGLIHYLLRMLLRPLWVVTAYRVEAVTNRGTTQRRSLISTCHNPVQQRVSIP